jgi:hypothetical protein
MVRASGGCHDDSMLMRIIFWLLDDSEPVWTERPF